MRQDIGLGGVGFLERGKEPWGTCQHRTAGTGNLLVRGTCFRKDVDLTHFNAPSMQKGK
jgi:hypothetical protein